MTQKTLQQSEKIKFDFKLILQFQLKHSEHSIGACKTVNSEREKKGTGWLQSEINATFQSIRSFSRSIVIESRRTKLRTEPVHREQQSRVINT